MSTASFRADWHGAVVSLPIVFALANARNTLSVRFAVAIINTLDRSTVLTTPTTITVARATGTLAVPTAGLAKAWELQ